MVNKTDLIRISPTCYEIPSSFRSDMKVPARIFVTPDMEDDIMHDRTLSQLINVATLQGIQKAALIMPDAHEGYGFPIGAVAATSYPDGVISPGGIGYDINCGVRCLISNLTKTNIAPVLEKLGSKLYSAIPSGVGRGGNIKLNRQEFDDMLQNGVSWASQRGYTEGEDQPYIESRGHLQNADPNEVSDKAKKRGSDQLGTMGAGNHFVEVGYVDEIFDNEAAETFGLSKNQATVLIHTGSRGLGHQVATDYIRLMLSVMGNYHISLPDPELACVPFSSPEGQRYFSAMAAAANFAWTNRQLITWETRNVWKNIFGEENGKLCVLYDVAHNIAKIETHDINGTPTQLIVHRKGATRAFGPGNSDIVEKYRAVGQPVLIPGSMGTASYILAGNNESSSVSFGSSCHGAGRRMSRHAALREVNGDKLRRELESAGIYTFTGSTRGLAEEAPVAYKDIEQVVNVVHLAGISRKVARLKPLAVVKG